MAVTPDKRMVPHHVMTIACAICLVGLGAGPAAGQETKKDPETIKSQYAEIAKRVTIHSRDEPNEPFQLAQQSVLNWSNPARKTIAGSVFLWTDDGRPQATLSLYPSGDRTDHEFQSLSSTPLIASAGDVVLWQPETPGVVWKSLENQQPPAANPLVRLRQLRNIARSFSAKIVPPTKNAIPLRLLGTPIYRYPQKTSDRSDDEQPYDGAVFAFVQGTDPEVLLLIEANDGDSAPEADSAPGWTYALARLSMVPMQVHQSDVLVWETKWAIQRITSPYYVLKNVPNTDGR